jgi:hypothetical protein
VSNTLTDKLGQELINLKPIRCSICQKRFRTKQGLRGHLTFVHGYGHQSDEVKQIRNMISKAQSNKVLRTLIGGETYDRTAGPKKTVTWINEP